MSDAPYTKSRYVQYRGPSTSEDYNARIDENYKDLVVLYNRTRLSEELSKEYYRRFTKDNIEIARMVSDLEERIAALEADQNKIAFFSTNQLDAARFAATEFSVSSTDSLHFDNKYGIVTLPKITASSLSKLSFTDTNGQVSVPGSLRTNVAGVVGSAESPSAVIDTSLPEYAISGPTGRIWERNVIAPSINANGAIIDLYVSVPIDLFTNENSNYICIDPFPLMGTDIIGVYTTSNPAPTLTDADGYTPVNASSYYASQSQSIGWVAPGAWSGDAIIKSGPKKFYFNPRQVTAFKIRLRRQDYYLEGGNYIYSYGASFLDLGLDKFLGTGKTILRLDAPSGDTISSVDSVLPQIYNIAESEVPSCFSYRTIWETSYDSGSYTLTPIAYSARVWIEITLNQTEGAGTPALSGLIVSYS